MGLATRSTFQQRLLAHIEEFFPAHYAASGRSQMVKVIELGQSRAAEFHLSAERDIFLYVSLMLYFGSSFHNDPQLPELRAALLNSPTAETGADAAGKSITPSERIDAAYDIATAYLNRVAGPDGELSVAAADRFQRAAYEMDRMVTRPLKDSLAYLHPQKYATLSAPQIQAIAQHASRIAQDFSLDRQRGALLCSMLICLLGHGFVHDPQFDWVESSLAKLASTDPLRRVHQFRDAAAANLNRWFKKVENARAS